MVNATAKRCEHQGCKTRPAYGVEGTKKAELCAQHAKPGMVDVVSKRCGHPGCTKQPSYGLKGSKAELCGQHANPGMVDVVNKRCGHPGCTRQPSYGVEGGKRRELCALHATEGMVDVSVKRCGHRGCSKRANHGVEGAKASALSTAGGGGGCPRGRIRFAAQVGRASVVDVSANVTNLMPIPPSADRRRRSEPDRPARFLGHLSGSRQRKSMMRRRGIPPARRASGLLAREPARSVSPQRSRPAADKAEAARKRAATHATNAPSKSESE